MRRTAASTATTTALGLLLAGATVVTTAQPADAAQLARHCESGISSTKTILVTCVSILSAGSDEGGKLYKVFGSTQAYSRATLDKSRTKVTTDTINNIYKRNGDRYSQVWGYGPTRAGYSGVTTKAFRCPKGGKVVGASFAFPVAKDRGEIFSRVSYRC